MGLANGNGDASGIRFTSSPQGRALTLLTCSGSDYTASVYSSI
uniref:Uncharacterized protein n=1 Tax=Setaria viridis TaxID=4556 RepID=A0A4U6VEE4_SETVI|nr:hypothetical protein SEVIR_3G288050v2 [Setaria viridis]